MYGFHVVVTDKNNFSNTSVKHGEQADILVKQYFDEAIYNFYFFDGEKLKEFFATDRSQIIQNSVFNISQVTLLENAIKHLNHMNNVYGKKLGKKSPDIQSIYDERDEEEKASKDAEKRLRDEKRKKQNAEIKLESINTALNSYAPIIEYQKQRIGLEENLKNIEIEKKKFKNDLSDFICRYTILLNLYPRMKHSLNIILEKELAGDLPPAIDTDQIKKLLTEKTKHCPLCTRELDEHAYLHLQNLIDKISVSSKTSHYLKEIKGTLENEIEECKRYKERKSKLDERKKDILAEEEIVQKKLKEINSILSNYDSDNGKLDIAKLEKNRTKYLEKRDNAIKAIGIAENIISSAEKNIAELDTEIEKFKSKISAQDETKKIIVEIESLLLYFNTIKNNIMSGMREEIESTTWKIFDSMIWKKNTFGHINIDDNYEISVCNKDGICMTGSLSATEQMALAYAFTLAIHNTSGKNCPLVIDSPLGRVSDDNRENMAKVLKEISKEKQIIMLFTPDEYSDSVKKIYNNIASVRHLKLSSNESVVEGVDK